MNILLATKNVNKHKEISKIFKDSGNFHKAIYKEDLIEVVEDKNTILENAQKKAFEIYNHYQIPVISDDSGLFVNSLNGMPGLRSKRYASWGSRCCRCNGRNAFQHKNTKINRRKAYGFDKWMDCAKRYNLKSC